MRVMGVTILSAFSGADDAIFDGLRSRNLLTTVTDGPLPLPWRLLFLLKSFRPVKSEWYFAWHHEMRKNPLSFRARTRSLDRRLRSQLSNFDVLLQVSGVFAPFCGAYPKPVTLFCDYTTKLAELNYRPWFHMENEPAKRWHDLETRLYHDCRMIFTASANTRKSLLDHYGLAADRVRVVGEGVHTIHEHPHKNYDESTVLFVGRDFERKGGPALLRAFAKVRQRLPSAKLLMVGTPPRGPQDNVSWLGDLADRKQMEEVFSKSTVLVLPSICEPFGLTMIEAMSHGLPVIGSTVDAMPEIIQEGESGYLVAPNDVDALADRLLTLLSSPALCRSLGAAGRTRVLQKFLWSGVVDRIEQGLREVCQMSASSA